MSDTIAAAVAFFALGANFLGTIVLLVLEPRSRALRWFAVFLVDIMVWLGLQGWAYALGEVPGWLVVANAVSVHLLPALFVVATLVDLHGLGRRGILGILGLAIATLPITMLGFQETGGAVSAAATIWQIAGWALGSVLHVRREAPSALRRGAMRKTRLVVIGFLVVVVPLSIILGFLTSGSFFVIAMPLVTVAIQLALFVGVSRLRFYAIEETSARRGELATDAGDLQRQALIGELAASFAHEVRNPLTGVRSLAQRLAEDDVDESDRRRYADVIVKEVGRVERIVSDLLGVSRRAAASPAEPGPTRLAPLLDDLRILLAPRAERAGVALRVDASDAVVGASRESVAQAVLNLLLNAIEHSPRGTRVDLVARADGGSAVVSVRDQGPGVPASERERIFEPLYSLRGGSGLGLAVVRRISNESGWSIELADAPGGGAEFRLRLPLTARGPRGAG